METNPNDNRPEDVVEEEEVVVEKTPGTGLKILVLAILIILLIFGIVLPIRLIPNASSKIGSTIGSWFSHNDKVAVSLDRNPIKSGEQVTLSWTGNHREDGSYILRYACIDNARLETSLKQPYENIPCSSDYYFNPSDNAITVSAYSQKDKVEIPLNISFLQNGSSTTALLADVTLTVEKNTPATTTPPKTATSTVSLPPRNDEVVEEPTPITKPKPVVSNPNGTSNIQIAIISTGVLTDSGQYIATTTVKAGTRAALRFIVTNVGDKNTGRWNFTASLPSASIPNYTSPQQPNIAPGNGSYFTLGFDSLNASTTNTLSITIHGDNITRDNTVQTVIKTAL
jgi:hypothetical protein